MAGPPTRAVVAAALGLAAAATLVGGSAARAQGTPNPPIASPNPADPGATVGVRSSSGGECPPPAMADPYVFVTISDASGAVVAQQSADVRPDGTWSVPAAGGSATLVVPPDVPPGTYQLRATCRDSTQSGGGSPYVTYADVALTLREQRPGQAKLSESTVVAGSTMQVGSGNALCKPPERAASPLVQVSFVDSQNRIRTAAQASVDAFGRWSTNLAVPNIQAQSATIIASCSASTSARAPYARYTAAPVQLVAPATTTTSAPSTTTTTTVTLPGTVTVPTSSTIPVTTTTIVTGPQGFPLSPIATPVHAEPSYTG